MVDAGSVVTRETVAVRKELRQLHAIPVTSASALLQLQGILDLRSVDSCAVQRFALLSSRDNDSKAFMAVKWRIVSSVGLRNTTLLRLLKVTF